MMIKNVLRDLEIANFQQPLVLKMMTFKRLYEKKLKKNFQQISVITVLKVGSIYKGIEMRSFSNKKEK